jgi:hypothetical protein
MQDPSSNPSAAQKKKENISKCTFELDIQIRFLDQCHPSVTMLISPLTQPRFLPATLGLGSGVPGCKAAGGLGADGFLPLLAWPCRGRTISGVSPLLAMGSRVVELLTPARGKLATRWVTLLRLQK